RLPRGRFLPSGAAAFPPHGTQGLAGGFGVAAPNREPQPPRPGIRETLPMILEIRDRLVHGATRSDADVALARPDQRGADVVGRRMPVEEIDAPAGHDLFPARLAVHDIGGGRE